MSDGVVFNRRDFLKLAGIGAAGALSGCAQPSTDRLIPYLVAPDNILPGVATWYASTCRECPAGCGLLVKTREGRAIKVEGNPAHPVNQGALCARGQATLQGLYNPDRIATPMVKEGGAWKAIGWDDALKLAAEKLGAAVRAHRGVAIITENATGSFEKLAREWAHAAGGTHLVYEPFSYESLREANKRSFGVAAVPHFDFARAKMVVSFGADFLETFGSPVAQARGFAAMRARPESGYFVAVEPRLSLTGANADQWVAVRPGGEMALALGLARVILTEGLGAGDKSLGEAVAGFTPEAVEQQTDVPAEQVQRLARRFAASRPSLAIAGGVASQSEQSVALIAAVNLLNQAAGNVGQTVRFDRTQNYDAVAPFGEVQRLIQAMEGGQLDVLVVHGANPVYATPAWSGFTGAMAKVPYRISLSGVMDETTERCDLVLPSLHALESLGDAETTRGVWSILQPTMKPVPMFDARPAGDTLIAFARAAGFGAFPASWTEYLIAQWQPLHKRFGRGRDWTAFWDETLKNGGVWEEPSDTRTQWSGSHAFAAPVLKGGSGMALVLYPSPNLYDGRGANKPWLQELPDPTSKAVWNSWVEIHPETAAGLGVALGDPVKVETAAGSVTAPAYLYAGIRKDCIAIPLGQGHTAYGRYAKGRGVNALDLLPASQDAASGAVAYLSARARISKAAGAPDLVMSQREKHQIDREIAQVIPVAVLLGTAAAARADSTVSTPGGPGSSAHEIEEVEAFNARPGKYTEPRQMKPGETIPAHAVTAYEPEHHARTERSIPVHEGSYKNAQHRWALAIDLNSCNGCQACVVACYAENNIPTVGPDLIKRGREMSWLRIERYEEKIESAAGAGRNDVRFVPMMCQQCGDAPCEPVCPVYATYHNPEGLNAQVYNRCVGTRYCSNNCPYKVRSFNFFDYSAPEKATFAFPEPLNWQLNPDVTVRSKGVMEKCTFCVQRILEGKGNARDENRPLRDGEIQTACAQGCPTQAIVFGDLMDPESRVSKLSHGERRYWALNDLNTKPGVTYLKKLERESA